MLKAGINIFSNINEDGKRIFGIIQKKGPVTKAELLDYTGMKLSTLNRIMQPLEGSRLIFEYGTGESSGGRRPALYDVNPDSLRLIGIDISRTYTQVVITNLKAGILYKEQFTMDGYFSPEKTLDTVSAIITKAVNKLNIDTGALLGIGVGTVGPLDRDAGVVLNPRNFIADRWVNVPIRDMLSEKLGLPVIVDNGANTAVLAEFLFGDGKKYRNIAYLNCGIGIRTGSVSSGSIVRTINDAEDVFGHMVIDVDGEMCSCGNYGCIECYSSIPSIVKAFISALKKGRNSKVSKPVDEIHYMDICKAADEDDDLAKEIITSAATILGVGLANFINLLNPGLVVLSGPLIKHSSLFYEMITGIASRKYYLKGENRIVFSRGGHFEDNAIAAGAAAMVVENLLNSRILG